MIWLIVGLVVWFLSGLLSVVLLYTCEEYRYAKKSWCDGVKDIPFSIILVIIAGGSLSFLICFIGLIRELVGDIKAPSLNPLHRAGKVLADKLWNVLQK